MPLPGRGQAPEPVTKGAALGPIRGLPIGGGGLVLPDISRDRPDDGDLHMPVTSEQLARRQAIQQVGCRRRFWFRATMGTLGHGSRDGQLGPLRVPQRGRLADPRVHPEQLASCPEHVERLWIIWPAIVWVLATAGYTWFVFGNKPASESDQARDQRQAGQRRWPLAKWHGIARRRRCSHGHGECDRAGGPAGDGF